MVIKEQVEITDEINSYGKDKLVELITFYEDQWKVGDEAFAHPAIQNMVGFEQLCTDVDENGYPKRIEFFVVEDRANKCWLILKTVLHRVCAMYLILNLETLRASCQRSTWRTCRRYRSANEPFA